jgi:hypothetical protein
MLQAPERFYDRESKGTEGLRGELTAAMDIFSTGTTLVFILL